jgi:hypothetical protein
MHSAESRRDTNELMLYLFGGLMPSSCDRNLRTYESQQTSGGEIVTGFMEVDLTTGAVSFHERFGAGNLEKEAQNG